MNLNFSKRLIPYVIQIFKIILLFTNFPLKITFFSIFQFLISFFCEKADSVFVLLMWAKMRLSVKIYLDKFDPVSMVTP
jgi:hypothetical protein